MRIEHFYFMEWHKESFTITTDKTKINSETVHEFLSHSYWAEGIPIDVVKKCIEGSLCFSVLEGAKQIGFARVITDEASFAYLADVFILEPYRGRGLSKWLIEVIMGYPSLQGLRRFMLATRDAHGLYRQFGFTPLTAVDRWMQKHNPDVYTSISP
jgi:GNAT superfamily N-acetyltransferase